MLQSIGIGAVFSLVYKLLMEMKTSDLRSYVSRTFNTGIDKTRNGMERNGTNQGALDAKILFDLTKASYCGSPQDHITFL